MKDKHEMIPTNINMNILRNINYQSVDTSSWLGPSFFMTYLTNVAPEIKLVQLHIKIST